MKDRNTIIKIFVCARDPQYHKPMRTYLQQKRDRGIAVLKARQTSKIQIAHNLIVDHLRKTAKHKTVSIDTVWIETDEDPDIVAEKKIKLERTSRAMEQLIHQQREASRLHFFGGATSKEAGSILNKRYGAECEMQGVAMERLRKLLVTDF